MSDDWEKFRNMVVYKMYVTDKERDEILPWIGGIVLVILIIAGIVWLFK